MSKLLKLGKIIVIVAPSGAGKSTLIKKLKLDFPELLESVSFTTRPMRIGEREGSSYFYISKEHFCEMRENGEFLEWAVVHENYYGTSKLFVEKSLEEGKCLLFDLDVQGADSFKKYFEEKAQAIFISPPSILELEKRLLARGTDSREVIDIRLNNARTEVLRKNDYDYLIYNDEINIAYNDLKKKVFKILNS